MSIPRIAAGLTALALAVVGGATSAHATDHGSASTAERMLGPNQVTLGDRVPWSLVGRGWYLTLIDLGPRGPEGGIRATHQLLDLVDPLGGRYQMAKTGVAGDGRGYRRLADWSPDGHEALLMVDGGTTRARAIQLDLRLGTRHVTRLGRHVASIGLGPDGSLFATHFGGSRGESLFRIDHDGTTSRIARYTDGQPLPTPDGSRVVVAPQSFQAHTFRVVTSTGHPVRTLRLAHACSARRWWRPGIVEASCWVHQTTELFGVPVDGSAPFPITAYHGRTSRDLGDLDARRLDGVTYLEAAGPCGVVFLARQHADGSATPVRVPRARGNVYLIGTRAGRLVLEHGVSCDGGAVRAAISHFDPTTGTDRIVAELPVDEAYGPVLAFGERRQLPS